MLRDIERGLPPGRAAALHAVPLVELENPRIAAWVRKHEARMQRAVLSTITGPHKVGIESRDVPEDGHRARVSARTWETHDWRASAWLLERRFPAEYGSQQPAQVTETVVQVLSALAALRQQPAPALSSFRHVPELPAEARCIEDHAP